MVVTIVEGVAGTAVSTTEKTDSSRGGVFIETSVLATREVGLVIIESRPITDIGDLEKIANCKPEVARIEDIVGMKTGSLVAYAEAQFALWLAWWKIQLISHHQITSRKELTLNNATIKDVDLRTVQSDGSNSLLLR